MRFLNSSKLMIVTKRERGRGMMALATEYG
jgi:hypothetical protein